MGKMNDDKRKKGLEVFSANEGSRLLSHVNSCVHCGLCAESCLYYQVFKEPKYVPAKKVDLVSSIYRRYHTFTGKNFPWLTGARDLDDQTVQEMTDLLFGACTLCGRCSAHCSIGVDIAYLVHTGRTMLAKMGYVPDALQTNVDNAIKTGNNMSISHEELVDTIKWLEEDLRLEVNDENARIPLDEPGKKIMYTLNPREPKFFPLSIIAMAKIFYAAGESWTLSTKMYDVTNYAFFSGDKENAALIAGRMYDEMISLGAERCVMAECGHGSRTFRWEAPNYLGKPFPFEVLTSVELIAEYIREGRIKTDPALNKGKVTLHDPCNLVRTGGVIDEQRYILKNTVNDFVEMTPHGVDNICCGGGGGQLAMGEYNDRRMQITSLKAEQIRKTGAGTVCTPCHNCIDQLTQTNAAYKLGVKIKSMAEIVADAIILTPAPLTVLIEPGTRNPEHQNVETLELWNSETIEQPIKSHLMNLIYLDNSATTFPKPEEVYRFMDGFYRNKGVNPGRSGFDAAIETEEFVQETRKLLTNLFHGEDPYRLTFSYNASDSLNMILQGLAEKGDHVVTTTLEHNSVLRPLYHMETAGLIEVTYVPFDSKGYVNPDDIRQAIRNNTKMVVVNHCSNVIGTVQPVADIGKICKENGVYFIVDASQTAGIIPIDIQAMGIDVLIFTGHKCLMGPTGIGGSYVMKDVPVKTTRFGGTGVRSAQRTHLDEFPYRLECGTLNILGVSGLNAGIKWLLGQGMENLHTREMELWEKLRKGLQQMDRVTTYCAESPENHNAVLSFNINGFASGDVGTMLDVDYNIACRTGLQCAPLVHQGIGTDQLHGTVRFSIGPFNTNEHIELAIKAIAEIASLRR
jgi:cysteine desulfurase family protein